MKLLLDENISWRVVKLLLPFFDNILHVSDISKTRLSDKAIWQYAKMNDYIIVTYDSDFRDLSVIKGFPPKVIWIRKGNLSKIELVDKLNINRKIIADFSYDNNLSILEIY